MTYPALATRLAVIAVGLAVALAGCSDDPTGPLRDPDGVLLLVGGDQRAREIFVVRPAGTGLRRLTSNMVPDVDPDWSPDGNRIVFVRAQDSVPGAPTRRPDIFVMNADGSGARRLYQAPVAAWGPRWSPDGSRIVFESYDPGVSGFRLFIMNADGSDVRRLSTGGGESFSARWSPDGTRLFFLSNRSPRFWWTVYSIHTDGTGERQISGDEACASNVMSMSLSPDGSRIAYTCDAQRGRILIMDADGTDPRPLTVTTAATGAFTVEDHSPIWSADGSRIAFTSNRGATSQDVMWSVYTAPATGGVATRVTGAGDGELFAAAWGPP